MTSTHREDRCCIFIEILERISQVVIMLFWDRFAVVMEILGFCTYFNNWTITLYLGEVIVYFGGSLGLWMFVDCPCSVSACWTLV